MHIISKSQILPDLSPPPPSPGPTKLHFILTTGYFLKESYKNLIITNNEGWSFSSLYDYIMVMFC